MKLSLVGIILVVVVGVFLGWYKYFGTSNTAVTTPANTLSNARDLKNTVEQQTAQRATSDAQYTLADVAQHNSRQSCWMAVNGSVYDVTALIDRHPGGADKILGQCGKDATNAFENQHGGDTRPETMLASGKIGTLK